MLKMKTEQEFKFLSLEDSTPNSRQDDFSGHFKIKKNLDNLFKIFYCKLGSNNHNFQLSVTTSMSASSPSLLLDVKWSSSSFISEFSLDVVILLGIVVPLVVCLHFIRRFYSKKIKNSRHSRDAQDDFNLPETKLWLVRLSVQGGRQVSFDQAL